MTWRVDLKNGEPAVLLGDASFFGTLAAVRDLGRTGAAVSVAETRLGASHSGSSRYCFQRLKAPSLHDTSYLEWLLAQGKNTPGAFLHATSDDMVWLMAVHEEVLRQRFTLFQAPREAVFALLDKCQLYAHARRLGIAIPQTHAPTHPDEVRALGQALQREGGFPVIVKPRTQACMSAKQKGSVVRSPEELSNAVMSMARGGAEQAHTLADMVPQLEWPLVQSFLPDAQHDTYSLAGFIDRHGVVRSARASAKVYQLPVKVGVGVAFEGRPVRKDLLAHVQALATATGYFGVFEAEFIHVKAMNEYLLMDFNPRFYGQMQFEVSRGMHLPRMASAAAHGDDGQLTSLCETAERHALAHGADSQRFCNRWLFGTLLRAQRLGGRLSAAEHAHWVDWMSGPHVFDFVDDMDDTAPQLAQKIATVKHWVRHPRSSLRDFFK